LGPLPKLALGAAVALGALSLSTGPPVPAGALIMGSLRMLLLSLAWAKGFAVGARRRSPAELSEAERVAIAGTAVVPQRGLEPST